MSGRKSYRRGRQGEDYAAHWLGEQGYQIRQRNVRVAYGELDLIAEKDGILYFVEVKTRQNGLGQAAESLTPAKRVRMRQAAYGWLSKFYQEHTIKNSGNYDIKKGQSGKVTSVNDELRLKYPGDILIELSPMGGTPIGPFGDPNNMKSTIESNILSFIYTMSNLNKVITLTNQSLENNATNIEETYKSIDEVYEQSKKSR